MSRIRRVRTPNKEAELDITSFMNLMIVLVPVLLLGMVFSQITVLDLKLPDAAASEASPDKPVKKEIELVIRKDGMVVNYPRGILLKRIPKIPAAPGEDKAGEGNTGENTGEGSATASQSAMVYDFKLLGLVLREMKRQLREKGIDNKAITVLSEPDTNYQTIVSAMDTVRSYKAVVAASVVDAELFPDVSFGDAPAQDNPTMAVRGGEQ